jgi:protein TonB
MFARLAICVPVAACVTFGLLFLMQYLISMSDGVLEDVSYTKLIEFVRLKRDTQTQEKQRALPEPQRPEEAPPPPELNLAENPAPDQEVGNVMPIADTTPALEGAGGIGTAAADSDIVPLVRVEPAYPPRAMERGIEGWVIVEFTISAAGTVKDPQVVDASPRSVFDRAALRAVRKWKYNPRIENGEAVERSGVKVRLSFDLEGQA